MEEGGRRLTLFSKPKSKEIIIRPMCPDDIEEVRTISQVAWTDLATRDVGRKVCYPKRSAKLIEAYMWKEANGCLVVESNKKLIGSAFCHVWGRVGWVGPIEVLPYHQDLGIGKALLTQCERYLEARKCSIIGLETMPHLVKNLHFYLSAGYSAEELTVIMEKVLDQRVRKKSEKVEEINETNLDEALPAISRLSSKINPSLDYAREWEMVIKNGLGTGRIVMKEGQLQGAALLHTYQRSEEEDYASIKMLATDPNNAESQTAFITLLDDCERFCKELGKVRIMTRFPINQPTLYNVMASRGYLLKGSNIRMLKRGEYRENGIYNLSSWAG